MTTQAASCAGGGKRNASRIDALAGSPTCVPRRTAPRQRPALHACACPSPAPLRHGNVPSRPQDRRRGMLACVCWCATRKLFITAPAIGGSTLPDEIYLFPPAASEDVIRLGLAGCVTSGWGPAITCRKRFGSTTISVPALNARAAVVVALAAAGHRKVVQVLRVHCPRHATAREWAAPTTTSCDSIFPLPPRTQLAL